MKATLLRLAIFSSIFFGTVHSHGYMIDPIGRASRWRVPEFSEGPIDNNDNQLYCGGASAQWDKHNGKCGACGDEYGIGQYRVYLCILSISCPKVVRGSPNLNILY